MKKFLAFIVIIILLIIGIRFCNNYQDKKLEEKVSQYDINSVSDINSNSTAQSESADDIMKNEVLKDGSKCAVMSQSFVKSKMAYPDEVNFNYSGYTHERSGENTIIIDKFTSKNGYGVKLSYTYKIWLKFKGGDWSEISNWSYDKLIIEGSDGTQMTY